MKMNNEMHLRTINITNDLKTIELDVAFELALVLAIILIAFMVLIFLGNGLTIWAYLKNRSLRTAPFNVFIISLAIADLLVGIISIPAYISYSLLQYLFVYDVPTVLESNASFFSGTPIVISVCIVQLMTIDRLRMVKDPINYKLMTSNKGNVKQVVFASVIGLMFVSLPQLLTHIHFRIYNSTSSEQSAFFYTILPVFNFYLPCAVLVITNLLFIVNLRRQMYKISGGNLDNSVAKNRNVAEQGQVRLKIGPKSKLSKDSVSDSDSRDSTSTNRADDRNVTLKKLRKVAFNLFVLVIAYLFCWCPVNVLTTITSLFSIFVPHVIMYVTLFLVYFNSVINPIIYAFINPKFRQAMTKAVTGRRTTGPLT